MYSIIIFSLWLYSSGIIKVSNKAGLIKGADVIDMLDYSPDISTTSGAVASSSEQTSTSTDEKLASTTIQEATSSLEQIATSSDPVIASSSEQISASSSEQISTTSDSVAATSSEPAYGA